MKRKEVKEKEGEREEKDEIFKKSRVM